LLRRERFHADPEAVEQLMDSIAEFEMMIRPGAVEEVVTHIPYSSCGCRIDMPPNGAARQQSDGRM
jgi:hypothetical protein